MRDVFIYDHVRTPRGRGKSDGSLHEVPPVRLATQVLAALKARNNLPGDGIDEVILGCVTPAGEQGATLQRIAPLLAGFDDSVPGLQLNRACAAAARRSAPVGFVGSASRCSGIETSMPWR